MPAKKKIADLPRKSLKARKADAVKGGRKMRLGQDSLSSNRRKERLSANHNQTLRTPA